MNISPPGLARDLIRLAIAVIRLIIAILTIVGGATNYSCRCLAHIYINSLFRTGTRYSSLRRLPAKLVQRCTRMCCAAGEYPFTSIIFAAAGISQPQKRTSTIVALAH
jgi:hypothetical protein